MSSTRIGDLMVKVGEYQKNGETKGRWKNAGSLMRSQDGSHFVILERTFNPAGVPNPENRDNVVLSVFEPKAGEQPPRPQQGAPADLDDTIPI